LVLPKEKWVWGVGVAIAVSIGIGLAALALPTGAAVSGKVPDDSVALVNGHSIPKASLNRALRDTKKPNAEDKKRALDKLVDDELMISHGVARDLVRTDPATRRALLAAVAKLTRTEAERREPDPVELEAFFQQTRPQYERPGRARLRQVVIRVRDYGDRNAALRRAQLALTRLRAGVSLEKVRRDFEAPGEHALPEKLMPIPELRQLVGPSALEAALKLQPGEYSEVLGERVLRVMQLLERTPPEQPQLSEVRDEVIRRFRIRAGDVALARKLTELRESANVRLPER
jgi:hypothetical protein